MPRLRARRRREAIELAGKVLTVDQVYDLVLAETESKEQASEAATRYMAAQLRAGQTPE